MHFATVSYRPDESPLKEELTLEEQDASIKRTAEIFFGKFLSRAPSSAGRRRLLSFEFSDRKDSEDFKEDLEASSLFNGKITLQTREER